MPSRECEVCNERRAQILRPKNHARLCSVCFIALFEAEVAETVTSSKLFHPGERIAIGASGGKDSCVLASVLDTLNKRHDWRLDLVLLSIDEGITGYRDHSLDAVRRNRDELGLPLKVVSYQELYGWSMDQVVAQIGKKGNCTYCGVFRRQALDRGAAMLGVGHVVTGHNADDVAETVLMNLLRGDLPRLSRATSIITSTPSAIQSAEASAFTNIKRSKPLMYAYEKEIVLYAHHKKLDYFSTECIYSPEAFRGSARTLIKNLERVRPESILDIVRSGVDMAKLVPGQQQETLQGEQSAMAKTEEDTVGGCGSTGQAGDSMVAMEKQLQQNEAAASNHLESDHTVTFQRSDLANNTVPVRLKPTKTKPSRAAIPGKQKLGQCERCGYMSSQTICKACVLLEGLNKARPRQAIEVGEAKG
ncbi:hypothetical protein AMS68_004566 [Peltaster fructicola]|uniref:Cytoplasmic tRNA 2-thiolation protein 1 n=1 Tax=Peltaster fructicola TaxID=286661 RepID=A0A6H0XWQ6_9PEZI|nr:hypothetical protein AMS68_004566 [Peltaster fructicola]